MGKEKISSLFEELKSKRSKALAVFLTAGYPTLEDTSRLLISLEERGADIIELGIPFSDPIADGPVIQKTSFIALNNGINLSKVLRIVKEVRNRVKIPIMLMGYFNPFLSFGIENLFKEASSAGIDGFIIPDLPPEEGREFYLKCNALGFASVLFISPVTEHKRIKILNELASGFLYFISITGITGVKIKEINKTVEKIKEIKKLVHHPLLVGFGISSPEEAKIISENSDGIIVGSSFLKRVDEDGISSALEWLESLKKAITFP